MVRQSIPRERGKQGDGDARPSTREMVADAAFCALLAEDLGVKVTTARTAFIGEPKVRCIRVVEWATRHEPEDPDKRAKMVLAWAKKRGAGAFGEDSERYFAEAIGRYWAEHPEKLAEVLREALGDGAA